MPTNILIAHEHAFSGKIKIIDNGGTVVAEETFAVADWQQTNAYTHTVQYGGVGEFSYLVYRGSVLVSSGKFSVVDVTTSTSGTVNNLNHYFTVLTAIRAVLERSASNEQASYTVDGDSLARRSLEELMALESKYDAYYREALENQRIANGGKRRRHKFRLA